MDYVRLGKSDLMISRVSMGAMSLGRIGDEEAVTELIRCAYTAGINFFDTSRKCEKCEKLLGDSIGDIREKVVIATKSSAETVAELLSDVESSLNIMHTDYIDLFQYESDRFIPEENGADGIFNAIKSLQKAGKIKKIGFVTQDLELAQEAVSKEIYDTLQFPFSIVSAEQTIKLVELCNSTDTGFIAMQPLCGGIVESIPLAFGFLQQFENVIPLWRVQSKEELDQLLYFNERPPVIDEKFQEDVEKIRLFFS